MRVLGLVHQYIPEHCAGAESHVHAMLRSLVRAGHTVDVSLSHQVGQPYVLDGVRIHPAVDNRTDASPFLESADLIVTHLMNTTRATVFGQFNDIPVVVIHHNDFGPTRDALVLPYSRTDLVVTNSVWMDESLIDWGIEHQTELPPHVIVRPVAMATEYATKPGDRVTLVNLRRLDVGSRDGLTKGGEIFRALAERLPRVGFLGVTGAYGHQQELEDLANVEVVDHVPHDQMRTEVYGRTRVLLVPSSYESWGRVASEALCSGIPVVATPTPGLVEQLGPAGIFVAHDDVEGWITALRRLLKPTEWAKASKAARTRAGELERQGQADLETWVGAAEHCVQTGGFRRRDLSEYV
jgi:glycosyltransferase involved in cell wall biosynthesis